jgi:hypothetical protein
VRRALALAATAAVALTAAPATANAATAKRCDQLRGTTKVKTARIKVVEVRVNDRRFKGKRALGCALPRGRVHRIAQEGEDKTGAVNQTNYTLGAHAGRYVAVDRSWGDGIALAATENSTVMSLVTGKRRRFYSGEFSENACEGTSELHSTSRNTPPVQRLVLAASGAFAVHYANTQAPESCYPNDGQALLRGFPVAGPPVQLDLAPIPDLPAASLGIRGSTVSWTNAGERRSRDLAAR